MDNNSGVASNNPALGETLLTASDVERRLRISHSTLYAYARRGLLPLPIKIGSASRWRASEIDAVMAGTYAGSHQ